MKDSLIVGMVAGLTATFIATMEGFVWTQKEYWFCCITVILLMIYLYEKIEAL